MRGNRGCGDRENEEREEDTEPHAANAPLGTLAPCFIATLLLGFSEQSLRENILLVVNNNNLFFHP